MRTALSTLAVARPRDLAEALVLMRDGAGRPIPIAGGTDLLVYLNAGTQKGDRFVDLRSLAELRGIRAGTDRFTVGALTTFSEIREHAALARRFPALAAAAAEVGGRQIQNRATVGGNIANASPAADSTPALLALDAIVHVRSSDGARVIALDRLFRGYRDLTMRPDELITAVELPFAPERSVQFFRKVGTRRAQSISKVVMAGVLRLGRDGRVDHVRIALGSVAPVTLRARAAEASLAGIAPSPVASYRARAALMDDIAPIDDIRSDREYRRAVSGNVLEQFLRSADPRFARG
ncbi:MAG: FAD binding domain-containing protein [Candidatus Eisenbacteria bacterium]|uniref:FAD binding domain-containing protein n=1 Tax=Eiseniibacteriota bacterium TaxID=2212470 RepID=A0A9D6LAM6_UNCEI|nr:FAD binding domain-containing protein [Candidatus Eisenbacteria bacterium]MBI3540070.1 FAD binding domain-containing protein [Candidatus Eisenbacteria bacterium]